MTHTKRERDVLLRNRRPTTQTRLQVPSTTEGWGSRSKAFEHERKLLAIRQILVKEARDKYDELDAIFQQIHEMDRKIEEQRQKQEREEE